MQVAVDYDVDRFRVYPAPGKDLGQRLGNRRNIHEAADAGIAFIAQARLDQDVVAAGSHQVTIEGQAHAVLLVGLGLAAPETLGNHAEDRATVPPMDCVAHSHDLKIAHCDGVRFGVLHAAAG